MTSEPITTTHLLDRLKWRMSCRKYDTTRTMVSLDGLDGTTVPLYVAMLTQLKEEKCLHRAMISHDAGWYEPGVAGGGNFRGYTTLFNALIPALKQKNFSTEEIRQLTQYNPREAFSVPRPPCSPDADQNRLLV